MGDIPVIDFGELGLHQENVSNESLYKLGIQVKSAFATVGFCYLKNHGIEQYSIDSLMSSSRVFFEQPIEFKKKYIFGSDILFGWEALEKEHLNVERPGDLKEAFDFCPPYDPDNWQDIEEFQKNNKDVFSKCTALSFRVFDALSVGLGLDQNFMRDAHKLMGKKGNSTGLRNLYYPPISNDYDIKPGQIRLGEHSDYGSITFVFQDNIGGLEVNILGKGYVPASPIPGTVVVNIGDLMQRWTADALIATKHRVLIPEIETRKRKPRQSMAFFGNIDDDFIVKCLDGSNKYEPIASIDYLKYRFSVTY